MDINEDTEKEKKSAKTYSQQQLASAIQRVKSGEITAYKVQQFYNIPRSTVNNHVLGKSQRFSVGRPSMFNPDQETTILNFIDILSQYGCQPNRIEFKALACSFSSHFEIKLNGQLWIPKEDWLTR